MWDRRELKSAGKLAFKANYWKCVLVSLIMLVITVGGIRTTVKTNELENLAQKFPQADLSNGVFVGWLFGAIFAIIGFSLILNLVISIFIRNPLKVGCTSFYIKNTESPCELGAVLDGFNNGHFLNVFLTMFMMDLFIVLWSFLFVIPGIIAAYSYRMVPYLVAENQEMDWTDALRTSKEMMRGNKWKAFVLDLSFFGWEFLASFTAGLLKVFYVAPYKDATNAELYKALKESYTSTDTFM